MANVKISELPAATVPLAGSELVPIVQSGTTDQVTVANLTAGRTVNAAALTATGTVSGATVTAAGTVSGATVTASGTVSGATVTASGTVSGATVSGTTAVVGAGTAAAPSIAPTGDTNTGMFFPAADQIAFAEGGVEAMRLDASGNVGIGTSSPGARLHVAGPASTEVSIRSTEVASWKTRLSFGNASVRWEVGSDINAVGNNNFYFYDVMAGVERARITSTGDFQFNSGYGSVATAYGCRAWVNWNGTGTVAIRGSANVSSITDNGVGDYTVNFATAMPDVNYCTAGTGTAAPGSYHSYMCVFVRATGSVRMQTMYGHLLLVDSAECSVAIFR